jgi:hypothetical protein
MVKFTNVELRIEMQKGERKKKQNYNKYASHPPTHKYIYIYILKDSSKTIRNQKILLD